jgi:flagellar biosynthetic protein FliR
MLDWFSANSSGAALTPVLCVFVLLWARLAGLFLLVPWLALRVPASLLSLLLSLAGSAALMPLMLAGRPVVPGVGLPLLAAGGVELVRGGLLGLGCALPFVVFEATGVLADALRGAVQPAVLEPTASSLLGTLYGRAALLLALAASAQLGLLRLVVESWQQMPLGAGLWNASALRNALYDSAGLVLQAFQLGVAFSAPVLIGTFLIALLLGLLMRVAAPIVAPLAGATLLPWLALGVVCLSASNVLSEVPGVVWLFARETTRLLGALH